jgi:hypothetical protein
MEWFRNFSDAITQPFVAAPVWQQMGTIILVGIPALVVLAWVLMIVIDLLGKVIRRVVSSDSTVTG